MTLREKINEIKKAVVNNGSNDKIHLLNNLLAEKGILIIPKNVSRKTIDEGNERVGDINRHSYSYELTCDFIISDDDEEIIFPSIHSSHVSHSDLQKEAFETMLFILFGVKNK